MVLLIFVFGALLSRNIGGHRENLTARKRTFGMDIVLRSPSGETDKEEHNGIANMLDGDEKPLNLDGVGGTIVVVEEKLHIEDGEDINSPLQDIDFKDLTILEPLPGMEFGSHGDAYAFYQEYSRSVGFNTAIQNSRRSKTSREFIDAKFACSRYGTKREYEKSLNRPRSKQGSKQDPETATGRRACAKTDCKASMHVKRRQDGKWIIHRFEKEHNHELLPAQAVSEQTRRMYAAMARQFAEYKSAVGLKHDSRSSFEKTRNMTMDAEEVNIMLEFFVQMQCQNSNFFYAVDVGDDQRLKSMLWVDAKSRHDYVYFSDVVSFDTSYIKSKYKMPLILFIGVNQYYQFMLLGCALISDETAATFAWVMQTWLKAMGGQVPKIMITDQDKVLKSVVSEIFASTRHVFCLWNIMGKVSETLNHIIKQNENFTSKFEKCIHRSGTDEAFEKRWHKLVDRFGLKENELFQSLFEDRKNWATSFLADGILAGMSAVQRSECVNSLFDKYVHKKTSVLEFVKQYESILQDRYEEEAKAYSDTWNKQPALKSPSPFEKHVAGVYTHAVFKRFQVEVLGAVACAPRKEEKVDATVKFKVQDFERNQEFTVTLNEMRSEVSCICHLFELKGYLCRHAMIVLQICGISAIPSQYILKRWTREARSGHLTGDASEQVQSRVQRYNDLYQRAVKLGEEASLSQESYNMTVRAFEGAFENCLNVNNSDKNLVETGASVSPGLLCIEEDFQGGKTNKRKTATKKRKVNVEPAMITVGTSESLQQMEKLSSRPVNLDGFFGQQQGVQGMVQLNLMAPSRDNYYGNQQTIQGLGQLNSIAPTHDGYYGTHPTMHGLGQMDFFRNPNFNYGLREESNVRSAQLHDDTQRHA